MSHQINSYLIELSVPPLELLIKSDMPLTNDMVLEELRHDLVRRMLEGEVPFVYHLTDSYEDSPQEEYDESRSYGALPENLNLKDLDVK